MSQGKLFNAVKRFLARIIKPYRSQKLKAPHYEPAVQDPLHVQAGRYQFGEFPANAEVQHSHQQLAQYGSAVQAPNHQVYQPEQAQSQHEGQHHHHQTESLIREPTDSLDAYCALYEDPGQPDGYITTKSGRRIPLWWDPPRLLTSATRT